MLRTFILFIFCILAAIVTVFLYPVYLLLKNNNRAKADRLAFRFAQICLSLGTVLSGADITWKGLEYLPEKGHAAVFIGNHRSIFDFILTYPKMKWLTGAVGKKELKGYPLIGWWMSSIYGIFIDRNDVRQGLKCILEGIGYLEQGISIMIFPEGKRNHDEGTLLPFHAGSFKLALKPGVPVIPMAINNTGAIYDDHRPFVKKQHVIIEFCEPIETADMTREEQVALPDRVRDIILERITANAAQI